MGPRKLICKKGLLSEEWLKPLRYKGYQVTPVVEEGSALGDDTKHRFLDGSRGWTISDGKKKVGVACRETDQDVEFTILFSSVFIWFGGNLKLASEIEALLIGLGAHPKS